MFSQTVEYALRAMVQLGADASSASTTKEIAAKAKVPSAYLAKVLQSMRRAGLIYSRRGVGGGVTLAKPAKSISLLDVIDAVEPLRRQAAKKRTGKTSLLQQRLDDALDQVRKTFASASLADMAPKSAKTATKSAKARSPVGRVKSKAAKPARKRS